MSVVHHCFSRLKQFAIIAIAVSLSACSGLNNDLGHWTGLAPSSLPVNAMVPRPAAAKPSRNSVPVAQKIQKPQRQVFKFEKQKTEKSAWCTFVAEDAAADATVLRAPTISGTINDEGRKSVGLGYDLLNIGRAKLIEDAAEAKCRRYLANTALNRMAVVAPNVLSRQGYRAKAKVIARRKRNLLAIKVLVNRELITGNLDRSQSTKLLLAADGVLSDGARASSEAAKRNGLAAYDLQNLSKLSVELLKAERDLADINSNIRSADAVSVNLNTGWRDGLKENGLEVQKQSFYGGLKVSVKLGALNPRRFAHERAATRAKLRSLRTEPGSVFWKLQELKNAQIQGRRGLIVAKQTLQGSLAAARRQQHNLPTNDPAYLVLRYGTEVEIIRLEAEAAGVKATLAQINRNLAKLRKLQYR
jgi:hypothetical protein